MTARMRMMEEEIRQVDSCRVAWHAVIGEPTELTPTFKFQDVIILLYNLTIICRAAKV
jgi:hypothetical protein